MSARLRRHPCAVACLTATLLQAVAGHAQPAPPAASLCTPTGYTVGFFNGVWNDEAGAANGLAALRAQIGQTFRNEPVRYEYFYNSTASGGGATFMQDIAETFIQRAREIDRSGELEKRWELLWEAAFDSSRGFWNRIRDTIAGSASVSDALYQDIISKAVAGWSLFLSNPPTQGDLSRHNARLDALAIERQKLMLVAHSQGNLFVNRAYDHVAPKIGSTSVATLHVAPASPTLRGAYRLADIDLVINGLRAQGITSVPANNLALPTSVRDLSGHQLVPTYLDPARAARGEITGAIKSAMNGLAMPGAQPGQPSGSTGFFTVTLTWDGAGDVDLHTFEPNGNHVYYRNLAGTAGALDVDNVTANGPEHYFASCNPARLLVGAYRFGVNNFSDATGRTATVQVSSSQRGELLTRRVDVGPERGPAGDQSPLGVFTVNVSRDAATGRYAVTAQ